ncbi:hypothetical protein [Bradyrhizobium sp.]|uniref:hypothetical protein n=1 Tax=Bradyrhizobium sp. TaxID=376 RepID=UPI00261EE9C1|nr:hypothetical protein [Bradyrhizobium sp.]
MHNSRPLNRREASQYLLDRHGIRRSPGTLAKLACVGGGPIFRKVRRGVIYDLDALDTFALSITSAPMRTTAELSARVS